MLPVGFGDDIRDAALLDQADSVLLQAQGVVADMEAVRDGWRWRRETSPRPRRTSTRP